MAKPKRLVIFKYDLAIVDRSLYLTADTLLDIVPLHDNIAGKASYHHAYRKDAK